MEVHIEGIEQVNAALQRLGPEVLRAADRGLKAAGMNIIADAKENLRANHTNATGRLSQSGRVQKAADGGSGYDVGFMSDKAYAGAVEYGRRAGRMPPPDELGAWAYKKRRIRDRKLARAAGWGLAKHIAKHVKIKAAGGIASIQDAEDFVNIGASRLGTSRIVKIVKNEQGSGY